MRFSQACRLGTFLTLMSAAALAQPISPSVAGKTCRGIFQVGDATSAQGYGAFQIRFAGTDVNPTAHIWRGFGKAVWEKVSAEVNSNTLSTDLTGFEDLGEAQNLLMQGNQVTLSTRRGAKIVLIFDSSSPRVYDGSGIISTASPGEPAGRFEWRSATAHMLCQ